MLKLTQQTRKERVLVLHSLSYIYSGADTRASDNCDMNPFMLAIEKGHLEVVKAMIMKDPSLVTMQLMGSGLTVIHWVLEKSHRSTFFKVCPLFMCMFTNLTM